MHILVHRKSAHGVEKMVYICFICKKRYATKAGYNRHARKFGINYKLFEGLLYSWISLRERLEYPNFSEEVK